MGGFASGDSQNVNKPASSGSQTQFGPSSKKNFLSQNYDSTDSEIFSVRVSNLGADATNVGVALRWREIY